MSTLWQFLILDGPVDTFWVENLNTLLDDSKVLCLSNGERINLTPTIRVVFEVDSLIHTSPATVSRCAMVYFEASDLEYGPNVKNWLNTLPKELPTTAFELINELFEFSLKRGFAFFEKRKNSTSFPFHRHNVLNTLFALMSGFIRFFQKNGGFGDNDQFATGD
jgi:dynein heavy chain